MELVTIEVKLPKEVYDSASEILAKQGLTMEDVRYEQIPKEKKVLIIDDIDQVKQSSFDAFLSKIDDKFEFFIFTSNRLLDLNLFERMKEQLKAADSIYRYQIMPFYADKRLELIQRIVTLNTTDKSSISKTVHALSDTLTAQRRFISLDPDFIIK